MKERKVLHPLSLLIALLMMLSTLTLISFSASTQDANIVSIDTAEELIGLAAQVAADAGKFSGKTVKLTSDIDLTDKTWTPIDTFKGTFDGQGYTIEGLTVSGSKQNLAMFNVLDGAIVKNLRLIGSISQDTNTTANSGMIAMLAVKSTGADVLIQNVYVGGTITSVCNNNVLNGAGFVAFVRNNTTIKGCASEVYFVGGGKNHAGFVGSTYNLSNLTLEDCVFYGNVPNAAKAASSSFIGHADGNVTLTRCLDLGYGAERDYNASSENYRGIFMYLANNKQSEARPAEGAVAIPSIVLEDCYVTMDTANTGLIGDHDTKSAGQFNISVKYGGTVTYTYSAGSAERIKAATQDKIKPLAVGGNVTLTKDNFATVCSGFSDWVVTDETVSYQQTGTKTVPLVLPKGILEMQVKYDNTHGQEPGTDTGSDRTGISFEYYNDTNGSGAEISYGNEYYITNQRFDKIPRTFEAWVYIPSDIYYKQRGGVIIGNYASTAKDVFINFEIHSNGVPRLLMSNYDETAHTGTLVDYMFSNATIKADTWTHVAIVYGAGDNNHQVCCYINGNLKQKSAESAWHEIDSSFKDNIIYLGGDGRTMNDQAFRGQLGDVAVYSDVRTADEIKADAQGKPSLTDDNLMLYYEITDEDQGKDIPDLSGNGYDMTYGKVWITEEEVKEIRKQTGKEYTYSIALIPDTQYTVRYYPTKLPPIYDFLIDNAKAKNIQYVISLGDMTDADSGGEWMVVKSQTDRLNGVIPYTVMRGNHDGFTVDSGRFDSYYAKENGYYYKHVTQNGGFFDKSSVKNTYLTFSAGTTDYIILTLDFGAEDNVLAWADSVLKKYADHTAIIVTHGYLNWDGTTLDDRDQFAPTTYAYGANMNNGDDMWNELIRKHENIALVTCGHIYTDNIINTPVKGDNGNIVNQLLVDSQNFDNMLGGTGMIAMMYFTEDGKDAFIEYYSTVYGMYFRSTNQIALSMKNDDIIVDEDEPTGEETTSIEEITTREEESTVGNVEENKGCRSTVGGAVAVIFAIASGAMLLTRKKED